MTISVTQKTKGKQELDVSFPRSYNISSYVKQAVLVILVTSFYYVIIRMRTVQLLDQSIIEPDAVCYHLEFVPNARKLGCTLECL